MKIRLWLAVGAAWILLPGLLFANPQNTGSAEASGPTCADCHEEQTSKFALNPHARKACESPSARAEICATCHGDGKAHMEAGGDKSLIKTLSGRQGSETCVSCHKETKEHYSYRLGVHASTDAVNCLTCHSIHKAEKKSSKLLAKKELDLCASCHSNVAASFKDKPYKHHLGRNVIECSSCHEPHGRAGKDMMKINRADESPCVSCHTDKRGPHVFPHLASGTGTCQSCHEPHGSNYPHQLTRASVDKLCLECHSPFGTGSLGSQPVATHNLLLPRWRNCTTCHTAIHGSNRSPKLLK
ncbi:MAG: hypothetical protein IT186_01600 [Acidobacteria bacterium]|nr:hypothetical protein [Acidobacteriota bacterium]MCG3191268.1 hypothetical protein [Thermoanaerobaculia bacterium]